VMSGGDVDVFVFPPVPEVKSVRPAHLVVKDPKDAKDEAVKPETTPGEASTHPKPEVEDPIVVEAV